MLIYSSSLVQQEEQTNNTLKFLLLSAEEDSEKTNQNFGNFYKTFTLFFIDVKPSLRRSVLTLLRK